MCNDQVCSVDFNVLIIGWTCIVRSYHKCCDGSLLEVDTDRVREIDRQTKHQTEGQTDSQADTQTDRKRLTTHELSRKKIAQQGCP